MKIKGVNPSTGEEFEGVADGIDKDFIKFMAEFGVSEEGIKHKIDNLNISADAKSLLFSFSKVTIRAGEYIFYIGRKILDYVCQLTKEFPNASFGVVFGAFVGLLISSIPFLGNILGPLLTPILAAIGLVGGLIEDIKDKALVRKIVAANADFSALKTR